MAALDVETVRRLSAPLDGNQLMARLGRPPGPWISRVQDALTEAVLEGEIAPGDEAAAWAYLESRTDLLAEA